MAENDEDGADEAPAVELGEGESVEGAPLARITSRLTWGIQKSEVIRKEGEETVRTADGPQRLADILEQSDETYFSTKQEFVNAVREVIGYDPVATAE